MANVIPFPSSKGECTPAELFLRIGEASYSKVASLYAEGRLPVTRAIVDASKLRHQLSFVKTLRDDGVELILDTKAAELGALSKFQGWASGAPWADGTLHLPNEFDDQRCRKLVEAIAREAVGKGFDRVLAPTHFLKGGVLDPWFSVDIRLCGLLREALDRLGGTQIAVDYPVIIEQLKLRDEAVRGALISQLTPLPFENLVIRASHFGADAKATGIREFINVLDRLHNFGRPIVVDHVGGIVARALIAFGVASGIAHGIDEHMRFDGTPWGRAPKERDEDEGRGGSAKRVSIPLLDKHLTVPELMALAKSKGGHGLLVCGDPNCCRGLTDMVNNSKRHSIHQESLALSSLNRVPDLMRPQHFLDKDLAEVDRFARQVKELKPVVSELRPRKGQTPEQAAASFTKRMADHAFQKEKMRASLENLHSVRGLSVSRAPAAHLAARIKENRKN